MNSLLAPSINLAVLLGILFFKLREPLKAFVASRHETIRDEIEKVGRELRRAKEEYDEYSSKLKALDAEVATLRDQAKADLATMKAKILSDAKHLSIVMLSDAKNSADVLFNELKVQLYSDLGGRILERAEELLKKDLTQNDQLRIQQEFSNQVETVQ